MNDSRDPSGRASASDAAVWDRIWSAGRYRLPHLRRARARLKVAAAIELGLGIASPDRVLDLGCGSGHVLIEAVARTPRQGRLVACDISSAATRLARASFQRAGLAVDVLRSDGGHLPFGSRSFDKVLVFMALQHVQDDAAVVREVDRVLERGGRVFVVTAGRYSLTSTWYRLRALAGRPPAERRNYTRRQLIRLLHGPFIVESQGVCHSGRERPFSAALDRLLARAIPDWGRYVVLCCRKA